MVVAHGLDSVGRNEPQQHAADVEICAGSGQAQVLRLAEQLALGSDGRPRRDSAGDRRVVPDVLGNFPARRVRAACDLAGELGDAYVGHATVLDQGRFAEQLVGCAADVRRRLAQ